VSRHRNGSLTEDRRPAFEGGLRLGRLLGIEVRADFGLLLVFALVAFNLAVVQLPRWHPDWAPALTWAISLGAAVLFFASILVHELSHAAVARAHGIPVRGITLFMFGGIAHIEGEPPDPRSELLMAIVGPVTSITIGIVATVLGVWVAGGALETFDRDPAGAMALLGPLPTLLLWLGPVNVMLGVFNLVPGFPLDGGRVLRAILWWITGNLRRATRWASTAGRWFAWALILVGFLVVFGFSFPVLGASGAFQGIWLILIGWFLHNAARMGYEQLLVRQALEHVPVERVMFSHVETITPDVPVGDLVREHILHGDQRCYPVIDKDRFVGLVCLEDVRKVREPDWDSVTVGEIMTRANDLATVSPDDEAIEAVQELARRDVDQIPVVVSGRLLGLFRRQDIVKWLGLRTEELGA